ncbi:MAG: tetratricopeptide repeat protein [Cyanobacteriota bacterium]|nr:tetratricopeptide repeat protein [Cyanobacteriota bacterium]
MNENLIDQMIGNRYRLVRSLNAGGMGQVFEAVDTNLFDRRIAVKILHQSLTGNENLRRRFQAEARISALLGEHPLIVRVMDYGLHYDQPYIVMEYLGSPPFAGEPLSDILRQEPMDVKRMVRLGRQIAAALQYAHSFEANQGDFKITGVIHRDIKPSNIFVIRDQTIGESIKLLDFGIAKTVADVSMALGTQLGFVGTPSHASPEQLRGEPIDFRSDIYSLGIVFYQMLSGQLPLVPKTESFPAWYEAHNYQQPRPIERSDVSPALAAVIMSCLEKEPDRRPASAEVLREQLKNVFQTTLATPTPPATNDRSVSPRPGELSPELLRLVRPIEVAMTDFNASAQFRLRGRELHILLEYPATLSLNRQAILQTISTLLLTQPQSSLDQVVMYGRVVKRPTPEWQETLRLADLSQLVTAPLVPEQPEALFPPDPAELSPDFFADLEPGRGSATEDKPETALLAPKLTDPLAPNSPISPEPSLVPTDLAAAPLDTPTPASPKDPHANSDPTYAKPEVDRQHLTLDLVDKPSQILGNERSTTQFSRLQRRAFLASFPSLQDRMIQVRSWSLEPLDSFNLLHLEIELKKSIIEIDPGAMVAYQQGMSFLQSQDWDPAIAQFDLALQRDPSLAEIRVYLGFIALQKQDLATAIQQFQTALEKDPSLAEASLGLGMIFMQRRELDEAIAAFQGALQHKPALTQIFTYLLKALVQKGYLKEAIQQYLEALQHTPQLITLRRQMAEIILLHSSYLIQNDDISDAIFYLKKATSFHSEDPILHGYLGLALMSSKNKSDWQDAATEFRIAIRLDPNLLEAHIGMGITLSRLGNQRGAINAYTTALNLKPHHTPTHYNLGIALFKQGELKEAIASFEKTLQLEPSFAEGYITLGLAKLQAGDPQAAIPLFETALNLEDADLAEAHCGIGHALALQGELSAAIKRYHTALDLFPMLAGAHAGIGLVYLEQQRQMHSQDVEAARAKLEMALRLDASCSDAHYGLGEIERQRQSYGLAVKHYEAALYANRSYTVAHYKLALVLAEQGKSNEAISELRITLEINPNFLPAQQVLKQMLGERRSG